MKRLVGILLVIVAITSVASVVMAEQPGVWVEGRKGARTMEQPPVWVE